MEIIKAQVRDLNKLDSSIFPRPMFDVLMQCSDGKWRFTDQTFPTKEDAHREMERLQELTEEEFNEMASNEWGLSEHHPPAKGDKKGKDSKGYKDLEL